MTIPVAGKPSRIVDIENDTEGGPLERVLTVPEAARILNLRPPRVYELIKRGEIPSVRASDKTDGKGIRIVPASLRAYIARKERDSLTEI